MATPSLAMIPSAYADSKVYSVLPNNGDGDFTFNRDSSATRVGSNGLIQTVGYFGNEEVTNGDFATDTDWTKGTGWTISGGKANSDGTQSVSYLRQNGIVNLTSTYKVQFTVSGSSSGTLNFLKGNGSTAINITGNDTYNYFVNWDGSSGDIVFQSLNFVGSIDNVSVQEVTGDQPRLNYDISNGVVQSCPSLLLEPASTNLITYSEAFSNVYWTKSGASVTSGFVSPDGSSNAYKLVEGSNNGNHLIYSAFVSGSAGNNYTTSFFVKSSERTWCKILSYGGAQVFFDLGNGVVGTETNASGKIEALSNNWYKISMTYVSQSSERAYLYIAESNNTTSYQGNGTSGIYVFGAQVEALSYATSYIPTNGASQTRAAETCNGAGTASTFNSTEGVLYAEIKALSQTGGNRYISLSNGTDLNRILLRFQDTDKVGCYVRSTSGSDADITKNSASISSSFLKVAVKWKTNDVALWVNGVEIGVDSSFTTFNANVLDRLNFAGTSGTNQYFYGNTKDIRVYNEALTDAQLQTLTTL